MNERNRMQEYTTGNRTVDAVGTMQFSGNVIPHIWYKMITRDNGKPYLLAITILSDIVYWYRPVEEREEQTGKLIGYRKRFRQDLLQRNYDQLADMFGESKRSVTDAVVCLEKLGIVKRVFRTIESGGVKCSNVLFLDLDAEALYQITFPEYKPESLPEPVKVKPDSNKNIPEDVSRKKKTGVPELCGGCPEISGHLSHNIGRPPTLIRETNTENTTKNTTEIKSSSEEEKACEGADDEKDREMKQRVGYYHALRQYPAELVQAVFKEIKNTGRERERKEGDFSWSPQLFAAICKNITEYAGTIYNQPAYIKKCLANILPAGISKDGKPKSEFLQNTYDFEKLEQELLEVPHIYGG